MKLQREIQRQILEKLAEVYPDGLQNMRHHLPDIENDDVMIANVTYLAQHELVESGFSQRKTIGLRPSESWLENQETKITARGIDFLLDDGGLGAILGVVTVKLDSSTIKALVLNQLDQTEGVNHEERSRLKTLLLNAGDQTMRKLVDTFVEAGLKAAPNSSQLIGMLQGLLA